MTFNSKSISIINASALVVVLVVFAGPAFVFGQTSVQIQLNDGNVRCAEQTIRLEHIARISRNATRLTSSGGAIASLDIESFGLGSDKIRITREQIRIRLLLAGLKEHQFELTGPDQITAIYVSHNHIRDLVESRLQQQLSSYYRIPSSDLTVTIDRQFNDESLAKRDFYSVSLAPSISLELSAGKQNLPVVFGNDSDQRSITKLPVTIAVVREMAVARQNIARGETLSPQNIESIRRPITDPNVRLASYGQAIGKQAQADIQQYDLVKPNLIRSGARRSQYAIKKNDHVNIIIRRGQLQLVMKAAKALGNGNPGDPITMVNPKTGEKIQATVVDSSTVEVRF